MARHVDGLIVPAPTDERAAYRRFACGAAEVWRGHGAPEVV